MKYMNNRIVLFFALFSLCSSSVLADKKSNEEVFAEFLNHRHLNQEVRYAYEDERGRFSHNLIGAAKEGYHQVDADLLALENVLGNSKSSGKLAPGQTFQGRDGFKITFKSDDRIILVSHDDGFVWELSYGFSGSNWNEPDITGVSGFEHQHANGSLAKILQAYQATSELFPKQDEGTHLEVPR
jgi:hypothetical protein